MPSGKLQQDSLFNMNSATQNQSAKGWNQTPIKITVGGAGIGGTGADAGGKGGGYVPSFIGSSKGDKKSKLNLIFIFLSEFKTSIAFLFIQNEYFFKNISLAITSICFNIVYVLLQLPVTFFVLLPYFYFFDGYIFSYYLFYFSYSINFYILFH